jgi:uncharacterized RDD family membrane protein YckC
MSDPNLSEAAQQVPSSPPVAPAYEPTPLGGPVPVANGKRLLCAILESLLFILTLGLGWIVWSLMVWSKGQSPAKSMMSLRCVRLEEDRAADFGTMALRELVGKWLVGTITLGITNIVSLFMILLTPDRQAVWDKLAGTVVVEDADGHYAV